MTIRKWIPDLPYILLGLSMVLFLISHAPNLELDIDPSYIMFGAARPPLYPMFLWLFHWAGSYQFYVIMWLQGVFLFSTLLYARYWLKKHLELAEFLIFLVCIIVTITVGFHFQMWYIQSEGLAFPLFILTFFKLVECFQAYHIKKLFVLAGLVSLLVLTRLQFYYFYLIFAVLLLWYMWQRTAFKSIIAATIVLYGSMFATQTLNHTYHYIKHGVYGSGSYAGLMLLVQGLYLADNNAPQYFSDANEKILMQKLITERNRLGLNEDASLVSQLKPSYFAYAYQAYSRNYLALQNVINQTLNTSVENTHGTVTISEANAIALKLDKIIFSHEYKKNMTFFIWKFVECMGGVPQLLFFFIMGAVLIFKIIKEKLNVLPTATLFVGSIVLITCLNAVIIALCNPDLPVYFCYSQFMLYCLGALLVNISIKEPDYVKGIVDQSVVSR